MSIEKDLQRFISEEVVPAAPEEGVGIDEPLISSGTVDSLGLLRILAFVQERYGVDLMVSGVPKDFDTIVSLTAAIRRPRGEA